MTYCLTEVLKIKHFCRLMWLQRTLKESHQIVWRHSLVLETASMSVFFFFFFLCKGNNLLFGGQLLLRSNHFQKWRLSPVCNVSSILEKMLQYRTWFKINFQFESHFVKKIWRLDSSSNRDIIYMVRKETSGTFSFYCYFLC